MAIRLNEAHQAFFDALHLTSFDASRVRAILTPQDWELVKQVHGLPFAYEIYSRLWHLRQLESAINTMAAVSEDIERHLRTLELGVGDGGKVLAEQFTTGTRDPSPPPPRTVRIYRPPSEDQESEPPEEAAEALVTYELGELPPVDYPEGRAGVANDFKLFCKRYFPERCHEWLAQQDMMAFAIDKATNNQKSLVFQIGRRGRGVTTNCAIAAIRTALYGKSKYLVIAARSPNAARAIIDDIKRELTSNERLAKDFPEVCLPLRKADCLVKRASQTHSGKPTDILWQNQRLKLPTIEGSVSSGVLIEARSISCSFQGMTLTLANGQRTRPDFVLVDDPVSDDHDAQDPARLAKLEQRLEAMLRGLPGVADTLGGVLFFTPESASREIGENEAQELAEIRKMVIRLKRRFQR